MPYICIGHFTVDLKSLFKRLVLYFTCFSAQNYLQSWNFSYHSNYAKLFRNQFSKIQTNSRSRHRALAKCLQLLDKKKKNVEVFHMRQLCNNYLNKHYWGKIRVTLFRSPRNCKEKCAKALWYLCCNWTSSSHTALSPFLFGEWPSLTSGVCQRQNGFSAIRWMGKTYSLKIHLYFNK